MNTDLGLIFKPGTMELDVEVLLREIKRWVCGMFLFEQEKERRIELKLI